MATTGLDAVSSDGSDARGRLVRGRYLRRSRARGRRAHIDGGRRRGRLRHPDLRPGRRAGAGGRRAASAGRPDLGRQSPRDASRPGAGGGGRARYRPGQGRLLQRVAPGCHQVLRPAGSQTLQRRRPLRLRAGGVGPGPVVVRPGREGAPTCSSTPAKLLAASDQEGRRYVDVQVEGGGVVRFNTRYFIDASVEGDLARMLGAELPDRTARGGLQRRRRSQTRVSRARPTATRPLPRGSRRS